MEQPPMPKPSSSCIIMLDSAIESDLAIPHELANSFSCEDEICDTEQYKEMRAEERPVPPCIMKDRDTALLDIPETVWVKPETLIDMKIDVVESLETLREKKNKDENEEEKKSKVGEETSLATAGVCCPPLPPISVPSEQTTTLPSNPSIPTMHITDSMIASAFPRADPAPPLRPVAGLPTMHTILVRQDIFAPAPSGPTLPTYPSPSTSTSTPVTPTYSSPSTSMTPIYPMINCEGLFDSDSGPRNLTEVEPPCLPHPQSAHMRSREFLHSGNKDDILRDPGVLLIADSPPPVSPHGAVSPPRADSPAAVSPPRTGSPATASPPWAPEIALMMETARPRPFVASTPGNAEPGDATLALLCTLCGCTFHPSHHLEHLLIMHKVNPRTLPSTACNICKITLPLVDLATHYAAQHMLAFSKTVHPHPLAFTTPANLRQPHSGYACTSCPSSFTTSRGLASHVRVHEGPFMCDCQRLFLTQSQMKTHKAKHKGKFNCTGCGLRFVYKLTLEKHKAKRCAPTCNICKDVFPKLSTLAVHARKSHPPFRHCHKCGLGFGYLETHNC